MGRKKKLVCPSKGWALFLRWFVPFALLPSPLGRGRRSRKAKWLFFALPFGPLSPSFLLWFVPFALLYKSKVAYKLATPALFCKAKKTPLVGAEGIKRTQSLIGVGKAGKDGEQRGGAGGVGKNKTCIFFAKQKISQPFFIFCFARFSIFFSPSLMENSPKGVRRRLRRHNQRLWGGRPFLLRLLPQSKIGERQAKPKAKNKKEAEQKRKKLKQSKAKNKEVLYLEN